MAGRASREGHDRLHRVDADRGREQRRIGDASWAAYASVGGRGYGRVDLRMDAETGALYVLEVNAQCGLSEDENFTSIGAILRFAERGFCDMVREIIDHALATRRATPVRVLA